ncbi:MAG: hypothetical protein AB1467_01795 [Candidatus Diapherotrites archaeon]
MKAEKFFALALFLLFITFIIPGINSLTIQTDNKTYFKGDQIKIEGQAVEFAELNITGTKGNKEIRSLKAGPGIKEFYSFTYNISCLDPEGEWLLTVRDANTTETKKIYVSSSPEPGKNYCQFLKIKFLSPSSTTYIRTSSLNISVEITDAGIPVSNAEAYYWDLEGRKNRLSFVGNGIYSLRDLNYYIKPDALTGQAEITVIAQALVSDKFHGGEQSLPINIEPAAIDLEIRKPIGNDFIYGSPIRIELDAVYPDGSSPKNATVKFSYGKEQDIDLNKTKGFYWAEIASYNLKNELLTIEIRAGDQFGNKGKTTLNLNPLGYWYFILQQNAIFFIFPALFIIYISYLSVKEARIFIDKIRLQRRKRKLVELKKKLQDDYFNKQLISRQIFYQQSENYELELDQIEERLQDLAKKQEIA